MRVLLVGTDAALLEGLAQSFVAQGYSPRAVGTPAEAREMATSALPLLVVVDQEMAAEAAADVASIALAPGGALIVYRDAATERTPIAPGLQRLVLAELTLPLERNRLLALAQHVHDRVIATGRNRSRVTPPERDAIAEG